MAINKYGAKGAIALDGSGAIPAESLQNWSIFGLSSTIFSRHF